MKTDFSQLYSSLGLRPGCTLAELRHAYRQRIGRIHPDRNAGIDDNDELPELLRLYSTAVRFHRRHGRLPGSLTDRPVSTPPSGRTAHASVEPFIGQRAIGPAPAMAGDPAPLSRLRPTPTKWPLAFAGVLAATMLFLALAWDRQVDTAVKATIPTDLLGTAPAAPDGATPIASGMAGALTSEAADMAAAPARRRLLEPGMDTASVILIQGKPLAVNGNRWDYGPSWLRFEDGQLVDWYNSPLHPLKVSGTAPAHAAR
ncbi:J domain-containing protein [Lysobacter ciconiae]|uniref:J domain-containing protein n=1 Tax=Novilysobacter ciconiae TaxID=2781022 RepID=A0A7S6UEH7_9GAMM|nr:J domain-containing protein [Lysobacter ciconiae]QOW18807.1 J domain-containing protein [Lysobacter ciconiae]